MFDSHFTTRCIQTSGAEIHVRWSGPAEGAAGDPNATSTCKPALLLLHGYPQTHMMWAGVAPQLAEHFCVVCPDLRGYGDSSKPAGLPDHSNYSKRAMAQDMVEVMQQLGFEQFFVAGHDRGARVTHRMALDHPQRIKAACVIDIAPTYHMFKTTNQNFATAYYHWFFLIQPDGLPEKMIGADPGYYLKEKLRRWAAPGAQFEPDCVAEYVRCFSRPDAIHASCEDYRAAASIDLVHDEADMHKTVNCPLLVLWGDKGFVNRTYDVLAVWRSRAPNAQGAPLPSGHFVPEEAPQETLGALLQFFGAIP